MPAPPAESDLAGFSLETPTRISPDSTLRLADCLELAHKQNPRTVIARLQEQAAKTRLRQSQAALLPTLRITGRAARHMDPQRVSPFTSSAGSSVASDNLLTWEAVLSLNLFAGGRDIARIREASEQADALRSESEAISRQVTFMVVTAWYQTVTRQAVVQAVKTSAEALKNLAERQKALLEQEKTTLLEVTRTQVRAAEMLDRLREEEAEAELALLRLFHLLGHPRVPVQLEPFSPPEIGGIPEEKDLSLKDILRRRPDLKAARLRIAAQRSRIRSIQAEYWPFLSLAGSFGQRVDISSWPVEDGHMRDAGYAGLELSWSPFEGGRIHYQGQLENATLSAMVEQYRALELDAVWEIRSSLSRLASAVDRYRTAQEALVLAQKSLELENRRLELGQSTFTDFQLIESATLEAGVRVLTLGAEVQMAHLAFRIACGEEI